MTEHVKAICLLGSNMGRRSETLRRAAFLLSSAPGIDVLDASPLYETPPWGKTDQPAYLNAAVLLQTTLEPEALLDVFQRIEAALDRNRETEERWGPRTADLDLALYGTRVVETTRLTIPHAHLAERAFALRPLLDVAPEATHPATGERYREVLERLPKREQEGPVCLEPLMWKAEILQGREATLSESAGLWQSFSPEQTEQFAAAFASRLQGGEVIPLIGALGAGKTCFARGLARGLGIKEPVVSPSYVLVRSYEGRLMLHHADFYRLSASVLEAGAWSEAGEAPELASFGLEDYLEDPEAVVLVEWADHFPEWLEPPFYRIYVSGSGGGPRLFLIETVLQSHDSITAE